MAKRQLKGYSKALIVGERCFLRLPTAKDCSEFTTAMKASRKLHGRWTKQPTTEEAFETYVQALRKNDALERYLVCLLEDGSIVGNIHFNNIIRGLFQNCFMSYCVVSKHSGQGYMTEGLTLAVKHAFTKLKLHRLEANIQPENTSSIALVKRCGFRKEGYSPKYLKIAGRWRDHERWAITKEKWRTT